MSPGTKKTFWCLTPSALPALHPNSSPSTPPNHPSLSASWALASMAATFLQMVDGQWTRSRRFPRRSRVSLFSGPDRRSFLSSFVSQLSRSSSPGGGSALIAALMVERKEESVLVFDGSRVETTEIPGGILPV